MNVQVISAKLLTSRGRFDDAEREMRRAQGLDPLSLIANAALGWIYLNAGRYDEAVDQCRRTLELNADFALGWLWMGMADAERGRTKDAVATLHHAVTLSGATAMSLAALARAHALNHEPDSARAIVDSLERRALAGYAPRYELAKVYLALGNRTAALALLVRALEQREHSMVFLAIDPQFEALRKDPAFAALLAVVEGG